MSSKNRASRNRRRKRLKNKFDGYRCVVCGKRTYFSYKFCKRHKGKKRELNYEEYKRGKKCKDMSAKWMDLNVRSV
jgi:uncharacterized protein (UPF0128 family)